MGLELELWTSLCSSVTHTLSRSQINFVGHVSGCGELGFYKSEKVFSQKSNFKQFAKVFSHKIKQYGSCETMCSLLTQIPRIKNQD